MRSLLLTIVLLGSMFSYGQQKVSPTGLNRNAPNKNAFGMKFQSNYYFSQHIPIPGESTTSEAWGKEYMGGGLGFFARFNLKEHFGLQTEIMVHRRQGEAFSSKFYELDSALTVMQEEKSTYSSIFVEIPVYLNFRWEYTPINRGHWKSKSAIAFFVGPRLVLTPSSKRDISRQTITNAYDQSTVVIDNNIERDDQNSTFKYSPIIGVGAAAGLTYELWHGFMIHAAYYRGILSHSLKSNGFKTLDNRVEFGIGVRFN